MRKELLISAESIQSKITETAEFIDQKFQGEELTIIMVMKGALCLGADLMRSLHIPCRLEFVQACSYGALGCKRGDLTISGHEKIDCVGKHLLIIDDIFDSGQTLFQIVAAFQAKGPKSLQSLVLLHKNCKRDVVYRPDWVLFEIEDYFVVGYGLDYKELYRGLPSIYKVNA